jgi:hypothetical protein
MNVFNIALYVVTVLAIGVSFVKDKQKTRKAFLKAFKAVENILPAMLVILMVIGVTMAWISPQVISSLIGESSGIWGVLVASLLGIYYADSRFHCLSLSRQSFEAECGLYANGRLYFDVDDGWDRYFSDGIEIFRSRIGT